MSTQVIGQMPVQPKVNGVTKDAAVETQLVATFKVNPFDEVLTKTMRQACEVLKLSSREQEETITSAIRNTLRASLKREADKLFAYTGRRRAELRSDGLPLEKIEEKMADYEGKIKEFESLYRQLEK